MRTPVQRLAVLLLVASAASAQTRIEPLAARLSPVMVLPVAPLSLAPLSPVLALPLAAVAPLPAPAALFAAPAAADGPARTAKEELSSVSRAAAPKDDGRFSSRSLNSFWDGLSLPAGDDQTVAVPPSDAGLLPEAAGAAGKAPRVAPWLAPKDKKRAAALDAAVKLARGTRAGRRALDAAQKALDAAGTTLPVDVLDLGRNYGEFDYVENRLRLDEKLFARGREAELAGTLAHELLHVAQHAQGLLSNALELEIEAHLLDLALMEELGLTAPPRTFARQAQEALAAGPQAFIALIQAAVPGSPFLDGSSFELIAGQLEQDLVGLRRKKSARAAKLVEIVERDLRAVRSKKGQDAYQEFSRRVLAELERRSSAAAKASS